MIAEKKVLYYNRIGDDMLKRVLSAIVMLGIFIPALIMGGSIFYIVVFIAAILALNELLSIISSKKQLPALMKFLGFIALPFLVLNNYDSSLLEFTISYNVFALMLLTFFLPIILYRNNEYNFKDALLLLSSVVLIGIAFNLFIAIRNFGDTYYYLLFIFIITSITDIYAHITGSLIGKTKLSHVSPNKTIEGAVMGSLFGTIFACIFYYIFIQDSINVYLLGAIVLFMSIIGQIGDLIFSSIKRYYGRKDFSSLIPGHGGILDRLDSVIFVSFIFVLFIHIL